MSSRLPAQRPAAVATRAAFGSLVRAAVRLEPCHIEQGLIRVSLCNLSSGPDTGIHGAATVCPHQYLEVRTGSRSKQGKQGRPLPPSRYLKGQTFREAGRSLTRHAPVFAPRLRPMPRPSPPPRYSLITRRPKPAPATRWKPQPVPNVAPARPKSPRQFAPPRLSGFQWACKLLV